MQKRYQVINVSILAHISSDRISLSGAACGNIGQFCRNEMTGFLLFLHLKYRLLAESGLLKHSAEVKEWVGI